MKAEYKGQPVEVWEISKTNERPDWVEQAFKENYLTWNDDRLKILLNGIKPSVRKSLKLGVSGSVAGFFAGGLAGGNVYTMGEIGDILDITHGRVITKKRFLKEYTTEDDAGIFMKG